MFTDADQILQKRLEFASSMLDVSVFSGVVASALYKHASTLKKLKDGSGRLNRSATIRRTHWRAYQPGYVTYATAENVLALESLGYDVLDAYVFLSSVENVTQMKPPFASIRPVANLARAE